MRRRASSCRTRLADTGVIGPYVVLHPTRAIASAAGRWPTTRLAELARAIAAGYGVRVVVSGSGEDRAIAERVASAGGALSLGGRTTIAEFGALAEGARAVVAMDSGPMHLAAAVGAPTVGIFALQSDEPQRWAPLGPRVAVLGPTYPCPPAHRKETCPNFACVDAIEIPRVLAALNGLAQAKAETPGHGNAGPVEF